MKRIFVFILFSTLFFLLLSCGIPSIYVPSSNDIVLNANNESGEFKITLSSTVRGEMSDDYPYIYFFYTVSSGDQSSRYSSLITKFNTEYSTETGGKAITSSLSNQPVFSYTDSSKSYGIYQFYDLISYQISGLESITLKLEKQNDGTLTLSDSEGTVLKSGVKRFNEKAFTEADFGSTQSEIVDFDKGGTYTVKVYALVSCRFNSYSNIYNTKLSSPILSFQVTI